MAAKRNFRTLEQNWSYSHYIVYDFLPINASLGDFHFNEYIDMLKVSFLRNLVVVALCFSSNLFAQVESSTEFSENASIISLIGSAVAVSAVVVAGEWIVTSVKRADNNVNVTMRSPTEHKNTTITVPANRIAKIPLAKGQKIHVEAVQTGYLFKTQGNTLGFLPNPKGKSLLHSHNYD